MIYYMTKKVTVRNTATLFLECSHTKRCSAHFAEAARFGVGPVKAWCGRCKELVPVEEALHDRDF